MVAAVPAAQGGRWDAGGSPAGVLALTHGQNGPVADAAPMARSRAASSHPPGLAGDRRDLRLWLIDDTPQHHGVAEATARRVGGIAFRGFLDGASGEAAFRRAQDDGSAPDVVLMDFFLGDDRGDAVTRRMRGHERGRRCTIIGYSSVVSGSEAIVAAGGDLILPKRRNDLGVNPFLERWLATLPRSR